VYLVQPDRPRPTRDRAKALFALMAAVFEERRRDSDAYVERPHPRADRVRRRGVAGGGTGALAGGLTAHALPMTRGDRGQRIYHDVGRRGDRTSAGGVGRLLMRPPARDNRRPLPARSVRGRRRRRHAHAKDCYRALAAPSDRRLTIFTFLG